MPTPYFGFKEKSALSDLKTKFTNLLLSKNITDAPTISAELIKNEAADLEKLSSPFPLFNCAPAVFKHIKTLHRHLKPYGHSLSFCQEIMGSFYGYKGWQEFKAAIDKEYSAANEDAQRSYLFRVSIDDTTPYRIGHENHVLEFSTKERFKQFCESISISHDTAWSLVNAETKEMEIVSRSLSRVIAMGESIPGSPYWMRTEYKKITKGFHTHTIPFMDGGMGVFYTAKCHMAEIDHLNPKIYPGVVLEIFRNDEKKPIVSILLDDYVTATGSVQKAKFIKKYGYYEKLYEAFKKGIDRFAAREKTANGYPKPKAIKKVKGEKEYPSKSLIGVATYLYVEQIKAVKNMYAARTNFTAEHSNNEEWWRLLSEISRRLDEPSGLIYPFLHKPTAGTLADIKKGLGVKGEHYGNCSGGMVVLAPGYGPKYQHQRFRRKESTQSRIERAVERGSITCDCAFLMAELEQHLAKATALTAKGWTMPGKYALHKLIGLKEDGWAPVNSWDTRIHNDVPDKLAKAASFADIDSWMVVECSREYDVSNGKIPPVLASPSAQKILNELVSGKTPKMDMKSNMDSFMMMFDDSVLAEHVRSRGNYSILPRHSDPTWNWGTWHFIPDKWLQILAQTQGCELHIIDHGLEKIPEDLALKIKQGLVKNVSIQTLKESQGGFIGTEESKIDTLWVKRFAVGVPIPIFFQEVGCLLSFRHAGRNYSVMNEMLTELLVNFDRLHMEPILNAYHMMLGAFAAAGIDQMVQGMETDFYGECEKYIMHVGEGALTGKSSPLLADFAIYFQTISGKLKELSSKSVCIGALWSVRGMFVSDFLGSLLADERWSLLRTAGPPGRRYYTD